MYKLPSLIAGNWKMNGLQAQITQIDKLLTLLQGYKSTSEVLICPPATLLHDVSKRVEGKIFLGGQDCHHVEKGAHTGDISASMLKDIGAEYVILGHSERRQGHNETDELVAKKVEQAQRSKLITVICVGEQIEDRKSGQAIKVVLKQLLNSLPQLCDVKNTVVAYEPIWAIGTGLTPSLAQIEEIHKMIREFLLSRFQSDGEKIHILYGGSVNPGNASDILSIEQVNGALVGGASLKATDFIEIIQHSHAKV